MGNQCTLRTSRRMPEELQLKLEEPNRAKTTFEMPAYPVKLIAHWSAIDPDESLTPALATMPALLQAVQLPPWPWAVQPSGAVTRSPPA